MGLLKILPRSIRVALFYVKAKKISSNKAISHQVKLDSIHKKEKSWIGNVSEIIKGTGEQDVAIVIGLKDIASIYIQMEAPDDALRYLNTIEDYFPRILERKAHVESFYEAFLFSFLHRGKAYALKGNIVSCYDQFDFLNCKINERITTDPSNSRLHNLYKHINSQVYRTYMNLANKYPEKEQIVFQTCLSQFKVFDERDPGNEQIQDYIEKLISI